MFNTALGWQLSEASPSDIIKVEATTKRETGSSLAGMLNMRLLGYRRTITLDVEG